jgi:hypothetical protein
VPTGSAGRPPSWEGRGTLPGFPYQSREEPTGSAGRAPSWEGKRPFGGPEQVFRYLGRYTHRAAISNARLVSVDDQAVVFRTHGSDTASLSPTEFIGRFLQHVPPNQFVTIRHFGLMASGNLNTRLKHAADLAPATASADGQDDGDDDGDGDGPVGAVDPTLPWPELLLALTGKGVLLCPRCQQRTIVRHPLPPTRAPPCKAGTA